METFLVISVLGSDRPGLVNDLSKIVAENHCNIADSRMTVLGGEFAVLMLVAGKWDTIAKLEAQLTNVAKKLDLTVMLRRTDKRPLQPKAVPYHISVVSLDHPGIVYDIANFFSKQNINIENLDTSTYQAAHTGSTMFNLSMVVNIPANIHLAGLREQFFLFCDERNLDAMLEPCRN